MRLTAAQEQLLRDLRGTKGTPSIARETGIARSTIENFYIRDDRPRKDAPGSTISPQVDTGVRGSLSTNEEDESGILDVPVRPLGVQMPPRVQVFDPAGRVTALLYGDTHFPNHSSESLAIVGQIAELLRPTYLVHMGDLLDCYLLSRFDKNPERLETLQDEINMARQHLAQMRLRTPESEFILLEGNHEDRLRRVLWNLKGEAQALTSLTNFRKALTWPALLGLDEIGVTFVPYDGRQAKQTFLPKWILKHGTIVRKFSAYTARGEMEKYGRSGASGHTHRLGAHFHQDHNGNHCWVETGCTCSLNPEYMSDPDWQQGCVVLTFEPETGAFQAEPIYIHNGLAVWRGNVLRA